MTAKKTPASGHKPKPASKAAPPLKNAADVNAKPNILPGGDVNAKPNILPGGDVVNTTASMGKVETTTPQSTPEGGFPRSQPHAEDLFPAGSAAGDAAQVLAKGVTPVSVAGAIGAAVDGKAKGKKLESRDELHDSIDPATGVLTPEATDLRAERGITASGVEHKG